MCDFIAFNKTIQKLAEKSKKLEDFSYTNRGIRDEIYNALNTTSFLGVSVSVIFLRTFLGQLESFIKSVLRIAMQIKLSIFFRDELHLVRREIE